MSKLVERLRNFTARCDNAVDANGYGNLPASPDAVAGWKEAGALAREAADEIERLQSLAGAVTPGPSLAEIKMNLTDPGHRGWNDPN